MFIIYYHLCTQGLGFTIPYMYVTLCLSWLYVHHLLSSMYLGFRVDYTLHALDSMFIVTLCSSSIIIYVLIIIQNTSFARTFSPSTTPISLRCVFTFDLANPREGCTWRRKCVILRCVQSRSVARPRQSIAKNERPRKSCNFTSRSVTRPGQSIVKIDASRLTVWKMWNFTSRFWLWPIEFLGRVARHA